MPLLASRTKRGCRGTWLPTTHFHSFPHSSVRLFSKPNRHSARRSKTRPCCQLATESSFRGRVTGLRVSPGVCRQLMKSRAESPVKPLKTKPLFSPHHSSAKTQVFWCVFPKPKEEEPWKPPDMDGCSQLWGWSSQAQLPHLGKPKETEGSPPRPVSCTSRLVTGTPCLLEKPRPLPAASPAAPSASQHISHAHGLAA